MPTDPGALPESVRAFLAPAHPMTVASVNPDGSPHQAVAWYAVEPDGRILLNSNAPRRWCANLVRDPRISLSVIDPADQYRWVGLTGVVDEVDTDVRTSREDIVALAHRYRPEGPSQASLDLFRSQPRVTFRVRITGIHEHLES